MQFDLQQTPNFSSILCLTGLMTDKQLKATYTLNIATIRSWKNKTLRDEDSWRRVCYELFIRYVPEKDICKKDTSIELPDSKVDLKKNITIFEIGEKNYFSFQASKKEYKRFIASMISTTPTSILRDRIEFLKQCIESR